MKMPVKKTRLVLYFFSALIVALALGFCTQKFSFPFVNASEEEIEEGNQEDHFITIYDQDDKYSIKTSAITVREALERAHIEYASTDIIEPAVTERITSDFNVNIYRSRPVIVMDGAVKKHAMTASFSGDQIAEDAGLTLYDGDTISLVNNQNFLEAGDASVYKITRNGGQTLTIETTIPYEEETVQDKNLASGKTEVRQAGEDGRLVTKYQVNFKDGVEVSREIISETVVKEPVNKITATGSKKSVSAAWSTCEKWAKEAGVSDADMYSALTLIYHESGCRVDATNASSGAYGIPQALPGNKMASFGSDWETNPVTQIKWMAQYVKKRYGGWDQALDFWWCIGTCNGVSKSGHWY